MTRLQGTDPTGSGVNEQKVDSGGRALAFAVVEDELEHKSEKEGLAFNWSSGTVDVDDTDTVLLVKNTSAKNLHVESISIANGSGASEYTIHLPTTEVTVTGATVTGTNLNTGSSNVADAQAASDETNNTQGDIVFTRFLAVNSNASINTRGLILGKNKSVAIDVVADVAESAVTIRGFYES